MRSNVGVMRRTGVFRTKKKKYKSKVGQISIKTFMERSKGVSSARLRETIRNPEVYNINYVRACKLMLQKRKK